MDTAEQASTATALCRSRRPALCCVARRCRPALASFPSAFAAMSLRLRLFRCPRTLGTSSLDVFRRLDRTRPPASGRGARASLAVLLRRVSAPEHVTECEWKSCSGTSKHEHDAQSLQRTSGRRSADELARTEGPPVHSRRCEPLQVAAVVMAAYEGAESR